jgi:hypothetical protein
MASFNAAMLRGMATALEQLEMQVASEQLDVKVRKAQQKGES